MDKKGRMLAFGALAGFLNGLLSAGGSLLMVPLLKSRGMEQEDAQSTSMAAALGMAAVSLIIYGGRAELPDGWYWVPPAMALGSFVGAKLMGKLKNRILGRIFALVMAFSGLQMLLA